MGQTKEEKEARKEREREDRKEARKGLADVQSSYGVVIGNQIKGTYDSEDEAMSHCAAFKADLVRQNVDTRDPEYFVQCGPMVDGVVQVDRVYNPQAGTVSVDGEVVRERNRQGQWVDVA